MPLTPGTRLGPYEILAAIGAGGMGEVYRAKDTKLHRDVAIKVLPDAVAADPDRLARFEREAQALAALNHPNIAQIYDMTSEVISHRNTAEMTSEVVISALVMELVDGEDLSARIKQGPIPLSDALSIARQIADAFVAAHEAGIVHRDLKPANVKVRDDGTVKVLDFGLAKALAPDGGNATPEAMNSPTLTARATQLGMILGTAAYMAPEQARGKVVDKRADIWAFGVVLFEMLVGTRPFFAEDVSDTLAFVLTKEPDWSALPAATPPIVRRLLMRCLTKDPKKRLHDIADARLDIDEAITPISQGESAVSTTRTGRFSGTEWTVMTAVVALISVVAFMAGDWLDARRGEARRLPQIEVKQLTFQPGLEYDPALSPDGKNFVFVANDEGNLDIYTQRADGGEKRNNLTKDCAANDSTPSYSPTGDRIVYRSECGGGGISIMGATGESPHRLIDFGFSPAWSPDGREIAAITAGYGRQPFDAASTSELWVINADTGAKRLLLAADQNVYGPSWSPHGVRIAYWRVLDGRRDIATVATTATPGTHPVLVTDDAATDWNPVWSPDGKHLYFGSDRGGSLNLWRVAIDEQTGKTSGEPEPLTLPSPWAGQFSISRDGTRILYRALAGIETLYRVAFSPESGKRVGEIESVFGTSLDMSQPSVSTDGQWIVFGTVGGHGDILLMRSNGSSLRHVTDDAYRDRHPTFSPNDERIAFYSNRSGRYEIWTINPDRSEPVQVTNNISLSAWYPTWRPTDGSAIAFPDGEGDNYIVEFGRPGTEVRHYRLRRPPEGEPPFLTYSWSPDGRLLAGYFDATSQPKGAGISVYDFAKQVYERFTDSGQFPQWLPDNRRLLYFDRGSIWLCDTATKETRVVFEGKEGPPITDFTISRDGKTLYFIRSQSDGDIWLATLR